MGSLDELRLNLGMGLSMTPEQKVPAQYASLEGLGQSEGYFSDFFTPTFRKGMIFGVILAIAGVLVIKRTL